MNPTDFDRISTRFAQRRLSQRRVFATGSVQEVDATPAATTEVVDPGAFAGDKTTYLFVQSFQAGAIVPIENQDGRFTVTLEHGTGQTIYFGDRPSRDVGVAETPQFLEGLGFTDENPPNAALIVETSPGETDVAVVELYNPAIDLDSNTVAYDVEALESWRQDLELGLQEEPADLATLAPEFGAAHLLIDDCPTDSTVYCESPDLSRPVGSFWPVDSCWNYFVCMPCEPYVHDQPDRCATQDHWTQRCNDTFPQCNGGCRSDFSWPLANC